MCTQALTLKQTPVPKKIARLFLVSDLLHNSSAAVPKASTFRSRFQATLPAIFESLHEVLGTLDSRMAIETMKEQVTKVLYIWQAWSLFPLSYITKLERQFFTGDPYGGTGPAPGPAAGGASSGGASARGA